MILIKFAELFWSLFPQLQLFINDSESLYFSTGFINESRTILDYMGFGLWVLLPILLVYLLYKLLGKLF